LFRPYSHHWRVRLGAALGLCLAVAFFAVAANAARVAPAWGQTPNKPREKAKADGVAKQASQARAQASVQVNGSLERELLRQLNTLRSQAGLRPLRRSRQLATAAISHSRSMAKLGYFSHESYDGSEFWQRVGRFYKPPQGFHVYRVGENLLSGPDMSASEVIRGWLNSPPHRKNLYDAWGEVGFGAVRAVSAPGIFDGATVVIITADFGQRG
jgi:uncharacterized protein YkwD